MTNHGRTTTAVACALLLALPAATGCRRVWKRLREASRPDAPAALVEQPATPTVENEPGLELVVWTADDTAFAVGRALRPYLDATPPVPEADVAAWRRAGLRVVSVPASDMAGLIATLRPVTPLQRQQFGQLMSWTSLVRGPSLLAGVGGTDESLPAGRPRLIARSWIEPDLSRGEPIDVVRTELGIQVETGERRLPRLGTEPGVATISDDGPVPESLLTGFVGDGSRVLVIVGEDPAVDWSELPEPTPAPASGLGSQGGPGPTGEAGVRPASEVSPTPEPSRAGGEALGPVPPRERTLGERMLSAPGQPPRDGRPGVGPRKVLVVVVPRPYVSNPGGNVP